MTYTTEEMPYEDDEYSARSIFIVGIQALEGMLLPILIQYRQVRDLLQGSFGRRIVVDLDVALEIASRVFDSHIVERRGRILADGINPEDEGYKSESE